MRRDRRGAAYRVLLLGSTSAGFLLSPQGALAGPDPCTLENGTRTCAGDQSDGISETGVNSLSVHDLTAEIMPASGTGIRIFRENDDVELESDTGGFAIRTEGDGAAGVSASSSYGSVSIVHTGDIETDGNRAAGVSASSGEYYGFRQVNVSVGAGRILTQGDNSAGISGSAGRYSIVTISNDADIQTEGESSVGIVGRAGNSVFVSNHGDIETSGSGSAGIAAGSTYEAIAISNTGQITTSGDRSSGLSGGAYNSITISNSGDIETAGLQSSGISAGAVLYNARVLNSGAVRTLGEGSRGIQANAQYGGAEVETSGAVTTGGTASHAIVSTSQYGAASVVASAAITTSGDGAHGVFASSGQYGRIDAALTGLITTQGAGSHGINAYSYGGNMHISVSGDGGGIETFGDDGVGVSLRSGGYLYGAMDIDISADIETAGANATGIHVEAGTDSALIDLSARIVTSGDMAAGIGMQGDYGGLTADIQGTIETSGLQSHGITFSSRYQGGNTITVGSAGSIRTSGDGASAVQTRQAYGAFSLTNDGTIATTGQGAEAIDAVQSGDPFAYGAPFGIVNAGTISASGLDATAIRIEANVDASLENSGVISGGGGRGAAVRSLGSGDFMMVNTGTIGAGAGLALEFAAGDDTVDNSGTITGSILLGDGANRFFNRETGILEAASSLSVGADGIFENSGLVYLARQNTIGETAFGGQFVQTAEGVMVFDLNIAGETADFLAVDGQAEIGGLISLNFVPAPTGDIISGDFEPLALITASGGLTSAGAAVDPDHLDVDDTVAYDFSLSADANTLWLEVSQFINRFERLLSGGSSGNQKRVAAYLDRILDSKDAGAVAPLVNALRMEADAASLQDRLDLLAAPSNLALVQLSDRSAYRILGETPCLAPRGRWCVSLGGAASEGEGNVDESGFRFQSDGRNIALEGSYGLSDTWAVSAMLSETEVDLSADWLAAGGDGNSTAARLGIYGEIGRTDVSVSAVWQQLDADLMRLAAQGGEAALRSTPAVNTTGISVRASRPIGLGSFRLEPSLSVFFMCHETKAYAEQGAAVEALAVSGWDSCNPGLVPTLALTSSEDLLRIGTVPVQFDLGISGQVLDGDDMRFGSRFLATGTSGGTFESAYRLDNRFWTVSGGVQASPAEGVIFRLEADKHQGRDYDDWSAALRVSFAF